MTNRALFIPMVIACLAALPALASADAPPATTPQVKVEQVFLTLSGVSSDVVKVKVGKAVKAVRGVQSFLWTVARTEVKIVRVVGLAKNSELISALSKVSVSASALVLTTKTFAFQKQLHCNGCVIKVKRALKAVKGTKDVVVADSRLTVTVKYDARLATVAALKSALAGVGYPSK